MYKMNGACRKGDRHQLSARFARFAPSRSFFLKVCYGIGEALTMHSISIAILLAVVCCYLVVLPYTVAEGNGSTSEEVRLPAFGNAGNAGNAGATLKREKRTLLLKKKLIGAGLLGFGLGVAKGYKAAYYSAPQVHHVYLSPPPASSVKYVEYLEKPIFVERIVERPSPILKSIHTEYKDPSPYGGW